MSATRAAKVVGPAVLPCTHECEVPAGVTLSEVPRPRHAWADVMVCPYEDCGRAWLIVKPEQETSQ